MIANSAPDSSDKADRIAEARSQQRDRRRLKRRRWLIGLSIPTLLTAFVVTALAWMFTRHHHDLGQAGPFHVEVDIATPVLTSSTDSLDYSATITNVSERPVLCLDHIETSRLTEPLHRPENELLYSQIDYTVPGAEDSVVLQPGESKTLLRSAHLNSDAPTGIYLLDFAIDIPEYAYVSDLLKTNPDLQAVSSKAAKHVRVFKLF